MRVNRLLTIFKEVRMINFIRLLLLHAPVTLIVNPNGAYRTHLQVYRQCKKKRIHHEWRINRKFRRTRKITIIGVFRNYQKRFRKEFMDSIVRDTLPALVGITEAMREVKDGAKQREPF